MKKIIGDTGNFRAPMFLKALLIMKLNFILILGLSFQVAAKGYSQLDVKISFSLKDAKLSDVLSVVERKSGYRIFYSDDDLPSGVMTMRVKNEPFSGVLEKLLVNTSLQYKLLDDKAIVLVSTTKTYATHISGRVTDSKNVPLANVSVNVKNSKLGTTTDKDGHFELDISDNASHVLVFSYVGFQSRERIVSGNDQISVVLEQLPQGLNEVVVVGYGKQKRTNVTAAVSTLDGKELTKAPVANISNMLGGRLSGVISRQSSGAPGADNDQIQIRGIGTIGNANPLIIVNGIPQDYNQLNPNEIESITVLKDAAAVAPYGLAGANGVVLVTTKRGKEGKFSLNYDGYYGFQNPTAVPDMVDAYTYAKQLSIANVNIGNQPTYTDDQLQKFKDGSDPDHFPNTDWVHRVIQRNAPITRHTLSFMGGSSKLRFYGNMGYLYQEGVVPVINFKRYNLSTSVDADVTSTTQISVDLSGSLNRQTNPSGNDGSAIFTNVTEYPSILPIQYANGMYANALVPQIYNSGYNNNNYDVFNGKVQIEQRIPFIPGLSLKAAFAYTQADTTGKRWSLPVTFYSLNAQNQYTPQKAGPVSPTLSQSYNKYQRDVVQAYITYNRVFGKHAIGALGVYELQKGYVDGFSAGRINYSVDLDQLSSGSSNKNDFSNAGAAATTAQVGWVYRVNYAYDSKYLVEFSGRYDGHYYFAPGKRYAFFPAFSVGWRLSEEKFIKDNYNWIDNLKLRGSYGRSGNLAGGPFQYLASYGLGPGYVFGGTAPTQVQGIYENIQSNPNITWEIANKGDIGLDGLLWKGKLGFAIDYFKERRSNMLIAPSETLPAEYGIGISQINAGIMENRGWEFSLSTEQRFGKDFRMNAAFNFTYAQNKLIQTFESGSTYNNPNRRKTGRPWNTQFGFKSLGFYQQSDFDENGKLKAGEPVPTFGPVQPGDIKYADLAGAPDADGKPSGPDGKIDVNDNTVIGDPLFPQITYGLNIGMGWKGIDLNMLWQGAAKAGVYLNNETAFPFFNGASMFKEQTDYWTPEHTSARYPRLTPTPTTNNTQISSFWLKDGSYLRLKTIELGYSLPASVMQAIKLHSVRFFVSGQNLITFNSIKFLDPELGDQRGRYYYQQKAFSFGLNIGF